MTHRLSLAAVLLILPALVFYSAFALGPMFAAGYFSFLHWDGFSSASWAGLENWRNVLSDSLAQYSIFLTFKMMILVWLVQTPISLLLGVFLAGTQRYRLFMGIVYLLPLLFSSVAVAITWLYILNPNAGALNVALERLGLPMLARNWLANPDLAFYVVVFVASWQFIPFHILLYQAGARGVPPVLYDAASIDGATGLQQFFHITLPQLKYTIVTSTILILTISLTYFDLIYVLTRGGPGFATRILPVQMYIAAFQELNVGYGSVLAVTLVALGMTLALTLLVATKFTQMESQQEGL